MNSSEQQKGFMEIINDILIEKYGEKIVELGENPLNYHSLDDANGFVSFTGPCGDTMKMWVKITDDTIEDIGFRTNGCDCTRATGSMLTELVKGKKIDDALSISPEQIDIELGGLPEDHKHCALLAKKTLINAIENYKENVDKTTN